MELTLFYKGPFLPFLSPYSGCSFLRCTLLEVLAPRSSTSSNGFLTVGLVSSRYHPLHLHTGGLGLGTATHLTYTQEAWCWAQLPTSSVHRRPGAGYSYPHNLHTGGLGLGTASHLTYTQEAWGWVKGGGWGRGWGRAQLPPYFICTQEAWGLGTSIHLICAQEAWGWGWAQQEVWAQ